MCPFFTFLNKCSRFRVKGASWAKNTSGPHSEDRRPLACARPHGRHAESRRNQSARVQSIIRSASPTIAPVLGRSRRDSFLAADLHPPKSSARFPASSSTASESSHKLHRTAH